MSNDQLVIRPAQRADLASIADIYDYYVANSTCTFEVEPEGPEYWDRWLAVHVGKHPAIVAVRSGRIVGWGSLSEWNTRCAYRFSVEDSVYVEASCHHQGVGKAILTELINLARRHGHRSMLAQIAQDQPVSELLHGRLGFRKIGLLKEVGFKFGQWIDVSIWQRLLGPDHDARRNVADD